MRPATTRMLVAVAAAGSLLVAACGGDGDSGGSNTDAEGKPPLIYGTTDSFGTVDPAGSYDNPGWTLLYSVGQTLMTVPPGETEPAPDAAKSCDFESKKVYTCKLKDGLKFSDGSDLTSKDVKFTFDRMLKIEDPNGPSSIYSDQLERTEAPNPQTVKFHLKFADATWPYRLTTGGASIVPDSYPADKLEDSKPNKIIGSGPYKITKYDPKKQIILEPNEHYTGDKKLKNGKVLIQVYDDESALRADVEKGPEDGGVHVAHRALSPTALADIKKNGKENGVRVMSGEGTGISYIAFNQNKPPFNNKAVRQAVAALVDRQEIADRVYDGTVDPLYTMVPEGLDGHSPQFKETYGEKPDVTRAKKILNDAGVKTPVPIDLWYNTDHYNETSGDMYAELKRQLDESGLFKVNLDNTSWLQYQKDYAAGVYQAFQVGWYPDFPDADNYLSPFYATQNFLGKKGYGYSNKKVDQLLTQEKSEQDTGKRLQTMKQIQQIAADDVPLLPLWQDKMIAAVQDGVKGVKETFDPMYTFRFWMISTEE